MPWGGEGVCCSLDGPGPLRSDFAALCGLVDAPPSPLLSSEGHRPAPSAPGIHRRTFGTGLGSQGGPRQALFLLDRVRRRLFSESTRRTLGMNSES